LTCSALDDEWPGPAAKAVSTPTPASTPADTIRRERPLRTHAARCGRSSTSSPPARETIERSQVTGPPAHSNPGTRTSRHRPRHPRQREPTDGRQKGQRETTTSARSTTATQPIDTHSANHEPTTRARAQRHCHSAGRKEPRNPGRLARPLPCESATLPALEWAIQDSNWDLFLIRRERLRAAAGRLRVSGAASAMRASAHDRLRVRSRPLRLPYGFQRRAAG